MKQQRIKFWQLLRRTFKSFNKREEISLLIFSIIFIFTGIFSYENLVDSADLEKIQTGQEVKSKSHIYSEGLIGEIKRLNPVFNDLNPIDKDIDTLIFSGLSKYDPQTGKFVSDIADHSLSADKKIYSFTISDNIKWHDGESLTAEDVFFTYHDVIQHPDFKNPILKSNFEKVKIDLIDNKTVTFTLEYPNSFFYTNTIVGILPKHILKDVPVSDLGNHEFNKFPIGSGPYKLEESYKTLAGGSSQVNLIINESYFGKLPKIKNLRITTYPSVDFLIKAKTALHGIPKISEEELLQNLREDERFRIYKYTLPRYTALFLNTETAILADKKVRLALSKSINKDDLVKKMENMRRMDTPLMELKQDEWIHKSNIEEAKGSLFDGGWKIENNEKFRKNIQGKNLSLRLISKAYSSDTKKYAEIKTVLDYLQKSWEEIGIELKIEILDDLTFKEALVNRNYDILLYGQDLGYNLDMYSYWHSTQANKDGLNLSNYTNPKADSLIESMRNLFDSENDEKKQDKLRQLQNEISEDVPVIVLYTPEYFFAADDRIKDIIISNMMSAGDRFSSIAEWYFVK